ncbi:MAG TPA: pilus assembly protein CpaB [Clostridiales bacterium]|nr:pilus assembly protein CpaB [Clostridiales bacterium]
MKNRTIIGILCIILAVTVMFGISPIINKMASGKIKDVQVNKKIEQGQLITAADITKVEIGSYGVKDGVIKDEKQIVGKFATSDIYSNINIYSEILTDTADTADDIFNNLNGIQAMSITISNFANGLSGKVQNGDIISVIVVDESKSSIPVELTYVKVITATTSTGTDSDQQAKNENGTYDLPATVTLLVNQAQAKLLALYEQNSKMHLTLVYRGDTEGANKFLQVQNEVFVNEVETNE